MVAAATPLGSWMLGSVIAECCTVAIIYSPKEKGGALHSPFYITRILRKL
jgi:hypothetical protein